MKKKIVFVICIIIGLTLFPLFVVSASFIGISLGLAERFLPFLMLSCVFVCSLVILLPLSIFSVTRTWAGYGFYITSFVFGITGWLMGLLLTGRLWGAIAVIFGLLILGIGVVPIAILATLVNGMWLELGLLVLAVILAFGFRFLGLTVFEKVDERH